MGGLSLSEEKGERMDGGIDWEERREGRKTGWAEKIILILKKKYDFDMVEQLGREIRI